MQNVPAHVPAQADTSDLDALLLPEAPGDSLEDLLSESLQQVADRKASQSLLTRIRQGKASEAEKAQATTVELKAAWVAVASCEMWDQVDCDCGNSHASFSQYMVEYRPQYQVLGASHRWVRTEPEALPKGLPVKAIFNIRDVSHCSECDGPPEGAEIIIWANGSEAGPNELSAD